MVQQPTQELVDALRKVSEYAADFDSEWNFSSPLTCSCGLLAKELGADESDIENEVLGHWIGEIWETQKYEIIEENYCPDTGLPNRGVFKLLEKHGLDDKDIEAIEMLGRQYHWSDIKAEIFSQAYYSEETYRKVVAKGLSEFADFVETKLSTS